MVGPTSLTESRMNSDQILNFSYLASETGGGLIEEGGGGGGSGKVSVFSKLNNPTSTGH